MRIFRRTGPPKIAAALLLPALAVGAVTFASPASAEDAATTAGGGVVMFGAKASSPDAVNSLESKIGRRLAIVRTYDQWYQSFPRGYNVWLRDHGAIISVSINPRRSGGGIIRWRDIANAGPGSSLHNDMVAKARGMKNFGAPIYFTFQHEPNRPINSDYGTSADFVGAYKKFHDVIRSQGANNVKFVWTMTSSSFSLPSTDWRQAAKWYPGDGYVDIVGADGYNWYTCIARNMAVRQPWTSFATVFEASRKFSASHGKGLLINEWGSTEDPGQSGRKGDWFRQAQATIKSPGWGHLRALLYYESGSGSCNWHVGTSSSSLSGFKAMGQDGYFGARS